MTLAEFAAVFYPDGPITVSTLRAEIRRGRVACARFGGRMFVTPADVRSAMMPRPADAPAQTLSDRQAGALAAVAIATAKLKAGRVK